MNVKIKKEKQEFKPFTIEFTIENEHDLCSLWHVLNIPDVEFNNSYSHKNTLKYKFKQFDYDFWEPVDQIVEKLKLKNKKLL